MASEQSINDKSYIDSLKKNRKELVQKKNELSVFLKNCIVIEQTMITSLSDNIKQAIEKCPKKENGNSENLAKRIEEMENKIEYTSMTVKEEREVGFENNSVRNSKTAKLLN